MRHVLENRRESGVIFRAFLDQRANDRQIASGIGMNKMDFHRVDHTGEGVLAGVMEMELLEIVLRAVDGDAAASGVIDLDGVTIVLDGQGARLVIELNVAQVLTGGRKDVNR